MPASKPLTFPPTSSPRARRTRTFVPLSPLGQICPINLRMMLQSASRCSLTDVFGAVLRFSGSSPSLTGAVLRAFFAVARAFSSSSFWRAMCPKQRWPCVEKGEGEASEGKREMAAGRGMEVRGGAGRVLMERGRNAWRLPLLLRLRHCLSCPLTRRPESRAEGVDSMSRRGERGRTRERCSAVRRAA